MGKYNKRPKLRSAVRTCSRKGEGRPRRSVQGVLLRKVDKRKQGYID